MNKLFQIIGIISLMCFSFFYTKETVSVVKEYDQIMITLRQESKKYKYNSIDAYIKDKTIIPGLSGTKVNINKSYSKMKRYGKYEQSLLVFKKINPKNSINNNRNKYIISGNKNKKMISLIFIVNKYNNIENIVKTLNQKNIKANFFVDDKWLEINSNIIPLMIEQGHIIGNLSNNMNYSDSSFVWMDTVIKKIGKQKNGYCYNELDDLNTLKICEKSNNYTIRPKLIISNNYLYQIKKNIKTGIFISFKINQNLEKELPVLINYIKSRGYKIESLDKHLEE